MIGIRFALSSRGGRPYITQVPYMLKSKLRLGILPCPTPANKLKIITTLRST